MSAFKIRILRDFRNYFIELKKSGTGSEYEIKLLSEYFIAINDQKNYFTDNDPKNLNILMKNVFDCLENDDSNIKNNIIDLHIQLFLKLSLN